MALQIKLSKALLVAIVTGLLLPAVAGAVGPARTPAVIIAEGFESSTTPTYEVTTLGQPSSARWAPVAYPGGVRGLWCAGSVGLPANYPVGTFGYARFAFPQAADHYASTIEFRYLMPTVGSGDPFQLLWERTDEDGVDPVIYLATTSSWKLFTQDLTVGSRSLARREGRVAFRFDDLNRVASPAVGQGPTIDDVVISGWKYGPVRSLHAALSASGVDLTWSKPYRAAGQSVVEERDVAYRVWRAPAGTEAWTEITPARITATTLNEGLPAEHDSYRYAVQTWDPSSGTGYGEPVEVSVTVPTDPSAPSVSFSVRPAGDYTRLAGVPMTIVTSGGSGTGPVHVRIMRDGQYWNGTGWQDAAILVPATASGASWIYTWVPDAVTKATARPVTFVAVADDAAGKRAFSAPITLDPIDPTTLSSSVSAAVIAYGGSTTIRGTLIGPLGPVANQKLEIWSRSYVSGSKWKKSTALRTTLADGSVSWTVKPKVRTYYQIRYPGADGYSASTATARLISPKVSLTAPRNGSAVKRGRVYTWYGYLKPKHTTGSSVARLQFQRKVGGVYKPYKTLTAKGYYTSSSTTRYSLRTSLPTKGMWRVRAYHKDAGHQLTYSGWLYKNVK